MSWRRCLVEVCLEDGAVTVFRLTELGRTVLRRQTPATAPADTMQAAAGPIWVVQPDVEITVYLEHAMPRQLALLECWAERQKAQRHVVQYRLTRQSVYHGLEAGHPEEELAPQGELLLDRVAADEGVEVRLVASQLRTQDAAQALGLLLARPESAGDLDRHRRTWQVDGEVCHLTDRQHGDAAGPELGEDRHLVVPAASEAPFRRALREVGYLLAPDNRPAKKTRAARIDNQDGEPLGEA